MPGVDLVKFFDPNRLIQVRNGVVVSLQSSSITVRLGGLEYPGIKRLGSYSPLVGESCILLEQGNQIIAVDRIGDDATTVRNVGTLLVGGGSSWAGSGDTIETAGANAGITIRQRSQAVTDSANRVIVYATDGFGYLWQNVNVLQWRGTANASEIWFPAGLPVVAGNTVVYNTSSKQLGYTTSSGSFKDDQQPYATNANPIYNLQVREFTWQKAVADRSNPRASGRQVGFIAEEVDKVAPNLVWVNDQGQPAGLNNEALIALLTEAVQTLSKRVTSLEQRLAAVEGRLPAR